MRFIAKVRKEIERTPEVELVGLFNKRPLYDGCCSGGKFVSPDKISNGWLKDKFSRYLGYYGFFQALYHLTDFVSRDTTEQELYRLLDNCVNKAAFGVTYCEPWCRDEFYIVRPEQTGLGTNPFACWNICVQHIDTIQDADVNDLIPLSTLKQFIIDRPGTMVIAGVYNSPDEPCMRRLIKERVAWKPSRKETDIVYK